LNGGIEFRMESMIIAQKMGFKELQKYVVYFIPFDKWNEI
jgi:hypothetical protein